MLQSPPSDDICYATQNRQQVVKQIAPSCDVVLVVGSRNSSNSVRLREVAVDAGARAGYLIDYASEIDPEWLAGAGTVGLTSGASVPDDLVGDVLARLAELGNDADREVAAAAAAAGLPLAALGTGSIFSFRFVDGPVASVRDLAGEDPALLQALFLLLLAEGVLGHSHHSFLCAAHTPADIDRVIAAYRAAFTQIAAA
jgi:hypothetical protein